MGTDALRFYAATDVGRVRDHNEDNFLVDKKVGLFMVCDGMGGHAAGEVASALAVRTVHEEIRREKDLIEDFLNHSTGAKKVTARDIVHLIEHAVHRACARIHEEALADPAKRGMGTTLSALLVLGHQAFIAHVGDSRIYMTRDGKVQQVTEDHTVINELIKRGRMSREDIDKLGHKNAITRAVGVYERVEVDTLMLEVLPGDTFLLCSDGLTGYLETADELLEPMAIDGDQGVKSLIALANARGGKDNITTVVVKLEASGAADDQRAQRLALKREVLARVPLFERLEERELLRLMQVVDARVYEDGQAIIREGERGDELFVVLSGTVDILRGGAKLTSLGVGEHFGEMALIRALPRSATATPSGTAELLVIRRADFFEILRTEHEAAVKMLWQFVGVLANRLDATSSELRHAKEELEAEDITQDLFVDSETRNPFRR